MWIEIEGMSSYNVEGEVTPFAGVWIEMCKRKRNWYRCRVTPFAGVWIEMCRI